MGHSKSCFLHVGLPGGAGEGRASAVSGSVGHRTLDTSPVSILSHRPHLFLWERSSRRKANKSQQSREVDWWATSRLSVPCQVWNSSNVVKKSQMFFILLIFLETRLVIWSSLGLTFQACLSVQVLGWQTCATVFGLECLLHETKVALTNVPRCQGCVSSFLLPFLKPHQPFVKSSKHNEYIYNV